MKNHTRLEQLPLLLALTLIATTVPTPAQSNHYTFTYQGRLKVGGGTPEPGGLFDYRFSLFDAPTGGIPISGGVGPSCVPVTDGLFTVPLDFGSNVFNGTPRWLEIEMRPATNNPAVPYTLLNPRQGITPAPQSFFAELAGKVRENSIESSQLMTGAVTGVKIADGNVLRSLNGLKDQVTLSVEEGLMLTPIGNELRLATSRSCSDYTNCYWNLLGNGNITAANFLGTVTGELDPLEFRVNNTHAMHIVAAGVSTPNIIGGQSGNNISVGVIGAHIGGGGEPGSVNSIAGNYDTIGGGSGHTIHKPSDYATISGGNKNTIQTNCSYSTIGGGDHNTVNPNAPYATVGGGTLNGIAAGARWSTVAGGVANSVGPDVGYGFIGGGTNNKILISASGAVIGGGADNTIQQGATESGIAGGGDNTIQTDADNASVGGGLRNLISASTPFATIPGGQAAAAANYGQFAYGSGAFTAAGQGEAQLSLHVLRRGLTAAVTNELFLDGDSATRRMNLRPESTWTFDILVAARTDAGLSAGYRITGVIRRPTAGAIVFVGVPATTVFGNEMGGGSVFVEADAANNALVIKAVGAAVPTRWVATVRTTEVIY